MRSSSTPSWLPPGCILHRGNCQLELTASALSGKVVVMYHVQPASAVKSEVSYHRHRFPHEVIALAVWLYDRFPLSLRMVEEMLASRGIAVTYEAVRRWASKFGQAIARRTRGTRGCPEATNGIWTKWWSKSADANMGCGGAIDQHGTVLDVLVQSRRDTRAAKRLMRKLLKKLGYAPRVLITDKLRSYGGANRAMGLTFEHRQHKGLNNRAENSHQSMRVIDLSKRSCGASNLSGNCSDLHRFTTPQPISSCMLDTTVTRLPNERRVPKPLGLGSMPVVQNPWCRVPWRRLDACPGIGKIRPSKVNLTGRCYWLRDVGRKRRIGSLT